MAQSPEEILRQHNLRKTLGRLKVLGFFMENDVALSHGDLSKAFDGKLDRASLYRTLQDFETNGLVHKVPDDEVSVKYAICQSSCSQHEHQDAHMHFKCQNCKKTTCLESTTIPEIQIPSGFQINKAEVLVYGVCKACA